jgi:quinol monooxygenase YgiN
VFSADPLEPGLVYLFERWESKEALAAHVAGMQTRPRAADDIPSVVRELLQYDIASSGPIGS